MSTVFDNKRIAKNTIILYVRMTITLLVSLYTTRVVLNVLGVLDYGIYNVVAGFVSMFAFLNTAMINTIQRFYNYERGAGTTESLMQVFNTAVRIQIIIAIITTLLLESFGLWYINTRMVIPKDRLFAANWVFQFSILSLIFLIMQIPYSAAVISHEKMDYYAFVSIIEVMLKLTTAIFLPFIIYDKLVFYGLFMMLISASAFLLYMIYARIKFDEIHLLSAIERNRYKTMLSFTGWNMLESISYILQGQGLNVLINAFFGPVVNAARGVAYQIQGAINGFSANIATAFRPQLVESYSVKDFERTSKLMFSMTKYCYLMLFILTVPISIELNYILGLWLKGTIPDYTLSFTYLVLVNMLINSFNMPITQVVLATGHVKRYQIIRSILNASPLFISWLFLRAGYNPTIVFWITIVISLINQPISMVILHNHFHYSYLLYFKEVVFPCIIITILSPIIPIVFHFVLNESALRFVVVVVSSFFISGFVSYLFALNKVERLFFIQLISKRILKH